MSLLEDIIESELSSGISEYNKHQGNFINKLEVKYPEYKGQIKYSLNAQLDINLKKVTSNKETIQEALILLEQYDFKKTKILDIANKYMIKESEAKKLLMREMFKKLHNQVDQKKLNEHILDYFDKNSFPDSKGLSFIKNNLTKDVEQFTPYILRDGFDQDFTGLEIGIKSSNEGDGAEHLFIAKAMIAGFNCSVVDIGSSKYDVVIEDKNGDLLKVQVKSFGKDGTFSRKGRDRGGQGIDSSNPSNKGVLVTSDNCDIFVAVNKSNGEIFIFSKNEIDNLPETSMKRSDYLDNWENWAKINQSI